MALLNTLSIPRGLATFPRKWLRAACQPSDVIGNCVYIAGPVSGGLYTVATADPTNASKMPVVGVIMTKSSSTICRVQWLGEIDAIYTGMTIRKPLFVGLTRRLEEAPPTPPISGYAFAQSMGTVLDSGKLLLIPNFHMVKRVW